MRSLQRRHFWLAILLLVCAMATRGAVPRGYMPSVGADGAITVKLCGSQGMWLIPLDGTGHGDRDHRPDHPCAFAGFAVGAVPPAPLFAALVLPPVLPAMASLQPVQATRLSISRPRPPARAPPLPA